MNVTVRTGMLERKSYRGGMINLRNGERKSRVVESFREMIMKLVVVDAGVGMEMGRKITWMWRLCKRLPGRYGDR